MVVEVVEEVVEAEEVVVTIRGAPPHGHSCFFCFLLPQQAASSLRLHSDSASFSALD